MYGTNFRAPQVDIHRFSMIPRADIPRSSFRMQTQHKTTFSASYLIPVLVQEVLPGDSISVNMTAFCRMSTPIFPVMDNLDLESWFFFVPCRILWSHWVNFMGEQTATPADSISYSVPVMTSPAGGWSAFDLPDYMGLPTAGQIAVGQTYTANVLPIRAYGQIWNTWFRDENLDNAQGFGASNTVFDLGDGPDISTNLGGSPRGLLQVRKRHDYFTSCLPWTQKGGVPVTLPLGSQATVRVASSNLLGTSVTNPLLWGTAANPSVAPSPNVALSTSGGAMSVSGVAATAGGTNLVPSNLYADLSTATSATINQIRLAFQTQRLLERDARGGTRYQELLMSHFGVRPLDARVQRPEYIGGGRSPVNISPVPQTVPSYTGGPSSPIGTLSAVGTVVTRGHGARGSFTEHGYIIGLVAVRRDQVYQQGVRRMWTRSTRYDFYWPVFSMLGEQAVRNDEIYAVGTAVAGQDANVFGYQERWGELRYFPSMVTGAFRSTYATPLDAWHCATKFTALPVLNSSFIADDTSTVLQRNLAGAAAANNEQFLADLFFDIKMARPLPMYSVPGLIDHF